MRIFKLGETVRVRKDLVVDEVYDEIVLNYKMAELAGKNVRIDSLGQRDTELYCYNKEHNIGWWFSAEMLEKIAKEYTVIVSDNKTIVIDKSTGKKGIATCDDIDTFDIKVGFGLAWDRMGKVNKDLPLYDSFDKVLKEGDKVYNICFGTGEVILSTIVRDSYGELVNEKLCIAHKASVNNGKYNCKDTIYRWKVLKA